jgi:hypothetical protein
MPQISVLMSVYNGEEFLRDAVESILNQTFTDFEFIIINDGSTDNSLNILNEYAEIDERIILINQDNHGLIASLNTGISLAKAPLIARMDADDISLSERLATQKSTFEKYPDLVALGSAVTLIDDKNREFGIIIYPSKEQAIHEYMTTQGSAFAHPAVMMKKETVLAAGGYRSAYKHAEDYDLWLRLSKQGILDNLPIPLLKYREHPNKISVKNKYQQALVSVIARRASQSANDPTNNLDTLDKDTLKLLGVDLIAAEWEILDIMASSLLMSPTTSNISDLEQEIPAHKNAASLQHVVRSYLKFALASYKAGIHNKAATFALKAFFASPVETLRLISKKLGR